MRDISTRPVNGTNDGCLYETCIFEIVPFVFNRLPITPRKMNMQKKIQTKLVNGLKTDHFSICSFLNRFDGFQPIVE